MRALFVAAAGAIAMSVVVGSPTKAQDIGVKNVVLVHGAWADGSGWRAIYDILKKDGYNVSVVANPLMGPKTDVAAVDQVLARQDGPTILVGHSYGGAVITEAGDDPKVVGLVYVAAFVPDVGESPFGLLPKDGPQPPLDVSADGFAFFKKESYGSMFASGVDPALAGFMADSQRPASVAGASVPLTIAAWKTKPSWYQVADGDRVIPPPAQRFMATRAKATVVEIKGGHLAFMLNPQATAALIVTAAKAARK
jgi:pimeloyl-ACP methyl ester carboxylesterase